MPTWLGGSGSSSPVPNVDTVSREGSFGTTATASTTTAPAASPVEPPPAHLNPAMQAQPMTETITGAAPPYAPAAASDTTLPNIDTITLDNIPLTHAEEITNLPERIGYLKEIGLDYSYGPTAILEWTLEHIHIWGGLPWWASIAATAVVFRIAALPLYMKAADSNARQQALVSITKPIQDRINQGRLEKNNEKIMQAWTEMKAVRKRAGIKYRDQLMPVVIQGVFGYCGFKLMRAAAALPVPGFLDGGFLWLTDLTISDGYLILPAVMAGTIHMMIRWGGETGASANTEMSPAMKNTMLYAMPGVIFLVTGWQSGAVAVWFAASGALGMTQALLLQKPAVRKFCGIAPMYKPSKEEAKGVKGPLSTLMESLNPQSHKALDVKATSRPTPNSSSAGGKNAQYMSPTYQSPNLTTTRSNSIKTFTKPGDSYPISEDLAKPSPGLIGGVTGAFSKVQQSIKDQMEHQRERSRQSAETKKKDAIRRQAQEYEKRAKARGR